MSAAAADGDGGAPPNSVDACTYLEGQLLINPNKVLFRRIFFLDPEKTKYISVGFYPARNYQPTVEIGSPKPAPVILTDQHVKTLSEHLPAQIDGLWRGDLYNVMDGEFAMHSASPFNTAILTVGKKKNRRSVLIKLNDLRYLSYIFPVVENQLIKYTEAVPNVMNYILQILDSTSYVDPTTIANNNILYYQLYEELKMIM